MPERPVGWLAAARQVDASGWTVLSASFLLGLGYFMAVPLLTTYITDDLGYTVAVAGTLIGAMALVQRGFSFTGGLAADVFGRRHVLLVGLLLRAVGFSMMGASSELLPLVLGAIVASVGGGLATPVIPAAVAVIATDTTRAFLFATRQTTANVAAACGPLVGAALLLIGQTAAFWGAGAMHLFILLLATRWLPSLQKATSNSPGLTQILHRMATSRSLVLLGGALTTFWALQTQLLILFPARAGLVTPGTGQRAAWIVSALFLANGLLFVVLQVALTKQLSRLSPRVLLGVGGVILTVGVGLAVVAGSLTGLFVAIAMFTVGEVLALPGVELLVSELAPPELLSSYFGVASVAAGIGAGFGGLLAVVLATFSVGIPLAAFVALAILLGILVMRIPERRPTDMEADDAANH